MLKQTLLSNLDEPTFITFKDKVMQLTPENDNENGPDFWEFLTSRDNKTLPGTGCFVFLNDDGEIVGTASIVDDDQGMRDVSGLDGLWIGGVQVFSEFRNRGYGRAMMEALHEFGEINDASRFNLFTQKLIPVHLYSKLGYNAVKVTRTGQLVMTKPMDSDSQASESNIKTGAAIMPIQEMPFFGIGPGNILPLTVEGESVTCGNLSWSKNQLQNEIQNGVWWYLSKLPDLPTQSS